MIVITEHAYKRANERLSLRADSLDKLACKAFKEGIIHSEAKGALKKYISLLYLEYRKANNIRIYGENVFLFTGNILITVYQLPSKLKKYLKLK